MRKRWAMGMTACVCALSMALTGCQIGNKDIVVSGTLSSRQVFTLDKSACSLKEAKVYLANYQNIYGTAYTIDLWQHDFGDASLLDYVKDITLEELTRVYTVSYTHLDVYKRQIFWYRQLPVRVRQRF